MYYKSLRVFVKEKENADREVIPIKAMEVVKTFDEIAAVLVKAGVPKEYFSLWPK